MKEISSEEMSMLKGGFAPLAPDPPLPNPSGNPENIIRTFMNLWPNALAVGHLECAD